MSSTWNYFHPSVHKQSTCNHHLSDPFDCYLSHHSHQACGHHRCSHHHRSHSHRSKNCYQWMLFVTFILLSLLPLTATATSYQDKDEIEQTMCSQLPKEKAFVSCPEDMRLVIKEVYYTASRPGNLLCSYPFPDENGTQVERESCYENLTHPIITKCMTAKNCEIKYNETNPRCPTKWGYLTIKYSCIQSYVLSHYCNNVLDRPFGYISSPTYPDYAASVDECRWTITAAEGQTIELKILDLQLTEPRLVRAGTFIDPAVYECTDSLSIDADQKLDNICGEDMTNLKTIKTKGPMVKISYKQNEFRATRGWVLRYQVNGCPKLKDPFKGHIVEQDETFAVISCCEGYIFKDSKEPKKYLSCLKNNWDGIVSSCINKNPKLADIDGSDVKPDESENSIDENNIDNNINDSNNQSPSGQQSSRVNKVEQQTVLSDFVIRTTLVVLLIVVVVIFIVTIVKCHSRRSKANLSSSYPHEATVPLTNSSPTNV